MDKQQTQQPVAWVWQFEDGEFYETPHHTKEECERDCCGYDGVAVPCFTAPPVPRDMLMAFGVEVADKSHAAGVIGNLFTDEDIAAIADRYASQAQPEQVNQQLLAALKACDEAMSYMSEYDIPITLPDMVRSAIAAAEAAQPAVTASTEAIALLRIWQTWLGASREQCDDVGKRLWDRIEAALVQPASDQPVAVPDALSRRCYMMSESHLSGYRLILGFESLEDVDAAQATLAAAKKGGAA